MISLGAAAATATGRRGSRGTFHLLHRCLARFGSSTSSITMPRSQSQSPPPSAAAPLAPRGEAPYVPPKVWHYDEAAAKCSRMGFNRPTAGPRFERELPRGRHPIQLYSLATPNGQKVAILLEELREAGHDVAYDAWPIDISQEDQFGSGFVALNPNSKIPVMRLYEPDREPLDLFESGSILLHLADKYGAFLPPPDDPHHRAATLNWLFWQVGAAPYLGGGFGHFYAYADVKLRYPIDRFAMEAKRQLHVLDRHLTTHRYMAGDDYTIADMAIWPWYGGLVLGRLYGDAHIFLNVEEEYTHVIRWAREIAERPAVRRGVLVNRLSGDGLPERHDPSDFDKFDL